ncbi:hypothetical protein ALP98_200043 [Pseudomonas viridiflava]|uniref:Teneurin-like YD-shell domain-containing protein n=2 Tax=Pseudomonas syringae group TaxID=136849 RepID=A0A3M4P3U0_PSEVI|nr:hypothetical protein ALQ30_03730 [Pseudomonas syringae pv. persicae]RMQ08410.1 hypothetical protein ALQ09_00038 [Pseudomonas viridiflava]RMQ72910.1 hypothetical protein ALP98_200043 [Pseudomonas viridiflava]
MTAQPIKNRPYTLQANNCEACRYDAAGNRLNFNTSRFDRVKDNRLKQWSNHEYKYDAWGNLVEKIVGIVRWQTFTYDSENRLVKTETMANSQVESTSSYQYDSLGRRVAKQWEIKGQSDEKRFLWQGLRMLREEGPEHSSLYLYEPGSYAPLARVDQREGETGNRVYYFHTDQIGTPLEMTDAEGQIVWQAKYRPWGAIEKLVVNEVEQNLRFQGQYFDVETGLHYNTFRYYDPEIGRFITQEPIGLSGGDNLYLYAPNPNGWVDPIGWMPLYNPISRGHHMVPHTAATKLGIAPFNSINNVPSMYWLEPGQWNDLEHSSMHGYNKIGANTRPLLDAETIRNKGLSNDDWLKSLEAHYNNPELASQRGDLRIVEGGKPGKIIAKNVSPAQAWEATKKWARSKGFSMGGCS